MPENLTGVGQLPSPYVMSACRKDAEAVAKLIEEKFPKLNGRVEINNIGTTIGSHTGPGTVALFFWGNKRVD